MLQTKTLETSSDLWSKGCWKFFSLNAPLLLWKVGGCNKNAAPSHVTLRTMTASWWWNGELKHPLTGTTFYCFFEVFPNKTSEKFAVLRVSICDGVSSWRTALQTSTELLTPNASSRINVIKEIMALVDSHKSEALRLSSREGQTPPDLRVRLEGCDIARVKFVDVAEDEARDFVDLVMLYLEADGAKAVDQEVALRDLQESAIGAEAMLQQEAGEQEKFIKEMADRMRLLCATKRDRDRTN